MLYGAQLDRAIASLGLSRREFSLLCLLPNGKSLSVQAIHNLVRMPDMQAKQETIEAVEHVLSHACGACGQHTTKASAWKVDG